MALEQNKKSINIGKVIIGFGFAIILTVLLMAYLSLYVFNDGSLNGPSIIGLAVPFILTGFAVLFIGSIVHFITQAGKPVSKSTKYLNISLILFFFLSLSYPAMILILQLLCEKTIYGSCSMGASFTAGFIWLGIAGVLGLAILTTLIAGIVLRIKKQ